MIQGASNDAVAKVLEMLSTDQAFREQMLGDPASALKPFGISVDPSAVPSVRSLPSMTDIAKIRQQFLADPQTDKSCIAVFIVIGAK
ncbi:NHLP-related RiPP peptide [Dokdonella sp.]|uniref:NHLP-related RiPP peptide n=1 Tax=Dokdonella sp. TaxID=2291710 RepID=UPI00378412C3